MKRAVAVVLMSAITCQALADVSTDLDSFMNGIGYASNVTSPQAFQSQAAGYYGGGSLYARNAVRQYQLVTLDMPDYRAGCAGIDLYAGSLSYISGDKLVNLGKQIMTNGGAYAVDVMLATTVPQLKQVRDYLQSTVQKVNQMSVNSCEAAQTLVGGLYPKTAASQQKICNDQRRMAKEGLGQDYVVARMDCAGNGFKETMENAANDPVMKKQVVLNKNIVWSLLREQSFLADDTELAELVMSLTGTLIIDKEGRVTNVPSLASSSSLIQALIGRANSGSQTAKIWHCSDDTRCLSVTLTDVTISEASSLSGRVRQLIASLDQHVKDDTKPTATEQNFLAMTPMPILKFVTVLNSAQYGDASVDLEEYSTLIAQDMMQQYLGELFEAVSNATQGSSLNEALLDDIRKRIDSSRARISAIDPQVSRKLMEKLALINNMVRIERQLAASLKG